MNRRRLLAASALLMGLTACGSPGGTTASPSPATAPDSYPAPATTAVPESPGDYPAPESAVPTPEGYPAPSPSP